MSRKAVMNILAEVEAELQETTITEEIAGMRAYLDETEKESLRCLRYKGIVVP